MHRAEIADEEAWHCLSDVGVEPSHHIAQLWMAIYIDRKLLERAVNGDRTVLAPALSLW
jgi:hypothetical protein